MLCHCCASFSDFFCLPLWSMFCLELTGGGADSLFNFCFVLMNFFLWSPDYLCVICYGWVFDWLLDILPIGCVFFFRCWCFLCVSFTWNSGKWEEIEKETSWHVPNKLYNKCTEVHNMGWIGWELATHVCAVHKYIIHCSLEPDLLLVY